MNHRPLDTVDGSWLSFLLGAAIGLLICLLYDVARVRATVEHSAHVIARAGDVLAAAVEQFDAGEDPPPNEDPPNRTFAVDGAGRAEQQLVNRDAAIE